MRFMGICFKDCAIGNPCLHYIPAGCVLYAGYQKLRVCFHDPLTGAEKIGQM